MEIKIEVLPDLIEFLTELKQIHQYDSIGRAAVRVLSEAMHSRRGTNRQGAPSYKTIKTAMKLKGEEGTTIKDLIVMTGLSHLTVSKAIKQLVADGRAVECGYRKGSGPSGSGYPATLYKIIGEEPAPTHLSPGARAVIDSGQDYAGTPFEEEIEAFFAGQRERKARGEIP